MTKEDRRLVSPGICLRPHAAYGNQDPAALTRSLRVSSRLVSSHLISSRLDSIRTVSREREINQSIPRFLPLAFFTHLIVILLHLLVRPLLTIYFHPFLPKLWPISPFYCQSTISSPALAGPMLRQMTNGLSSLRFRPTISDSMATRSEAQVVLMQILGSRILWQRKIVSSSASILLPRQILRLPIRKHLETNLPLCPVFVNPSPFISLLSTQNPFSNPTVQCLVFVELTPPVAFSLVTCF